MVNAYIFYEHALDYCYFTTIHSINVQIKGMIMNEAIQRIQDALLNWYDLHDLKFPE